MPQLTLDVTADATAAAASLDSVGTAAKGMADDVSAAATQADTAAGSMDGLAGSADNVDSKMGAATGALGALAGGLEAAGFEGAAAGLSGVAVATDTLSGAGGLLSLALESQAAQFVIAKAQAVAHTAVMAAQKTATVVSTGAQWALNAALSANPIGLVVAALALLVGGLVLAYQKSETFRDIVDGAMGVVRDAVDLVWGAIKTAVGWVGDLVDVDWGPLKTAADAVLGPVKDAVDGVSGALESAIGWVQDLIAWLAKIDVPDIDIPFVGRNSFTDPGGKPTAGTGDAGTPPDRGLLAIALTVEPPADKDETTRKMVEALREYFARQGQTLSLTAAS